MKILISKGGEQTGPFTVQEVETQLHRKTISRNDHAWWEGQADWVQISEIPEIRDALKQEPIALTVADLVPVESTIIWRPLLPRWLELTGILIVFGSLVGMVDPVLQALNWAKLRNWPEFRRSLIWVASLLAVLIGLLVSTSLGLGIRGFGAVGVWIVALVLWYEIQGRRQVRFAKTQPRGAVKYRSTKGIGYAVIMVQHLLLAWGYFAYQSHAIEISARAKINQVLAKSDLGRFECVQVQLGDKIADQLYRAQAVFDTGETIPLSLKVLAGPLSTEMIVRTLPAYIGWTDAPSLDEEISLRLNGREFLESNSALEMLR